MKYLIWLVVFFSTTAIAIPFGFVYGQSKDGVHYSILDKSHYQYCKLTDYPEVNSFYLPNNQADYNFSEKVRSEYKKLGVDLSLRINELKDPRTMNFIIDFPFPISSGISDEVLNNLADERNEHKMTKVYKRKKYIFEKLRLEPIFKEFISFQPSSYQFETIVYQLPNVNVCAQFKNNSLVQIGFNNEGGTKRFNKIVNAITSKYKGTIKTYELKKYHNRIAICGHLNAKDDCFLSEFNALTHSEERIKAIYHDAKFESSFFKQALFENDRGYKFPFVNYVDHRDFVIHEAAIEEEQIEFNTVIMEKLYLRLQELFNESKNLKKDKDSFLEQF